VGGGRQRHEGVVGRRSYISPVAGAGVAVWTAVVHWKPAAAAAVSEFRFRSKLNFELNVKATKMAKDIAV
jgi:hypothetical protein